MRTPIEAGPLAIEAVELKKAAMFFRAVNHPLRQQMLRLLHKRGDMIVTDVYVKLRLQQSVASQHLGILRQARLVRAVKEGKNVFYSVDYAQLEKLHKIAAQLLK